ncbi:folate transporter 1 [Actinidia rufa]|uniref:Folate transporter 1 n=1 Tax=Actinidia rufa TaxID=165716 RepID=A0A7J0E1F8_9ERIC|nr:folate transporter 1 [Actinidia rufa]
MSAWKSVNWQWENATAGAVAGLATVAFSHPLDVVRTRFQVSDGRTSNLPAYKNTSQALWTIARTESAPNMGIMETQNHIPIPLTISVLKSVRRYSKAKQRYLKGKQELTPVLHLASAAEAGALVCFCTNPLWLVKTRLQLQTPLHQTRPYSGLYGLLYILH